MARADALWPLRGDLSKAQRAVELYKEVLAKDPQNVEALWKLARMHYWIGSHTQDKKAKLKVLQEGILYAKRAISLQEDCVDCHYWLGVNYGVYGEAKGVLKSLSLVEPIKEEMNRVIALDPDYRGGAAYRILGRLYFKLPWFAGGSKKESVRYLRKALQLDPKSFLTRVFLAETYLSMKKRDLAREHLLWVINAPDPDDPADKEDKEKAMEIYEKHFAGD
jgi:tetratricopeptide (TPR) repeat protein